MAEPFAAASESAWDKRRRRWQNSGPCHAGLLGTRVNAR